MTYSLFRGQSEQKSGTCWDPSIQILHDVNINCDQGGGRK